MPLTAQSAVANLTALSLAQLPQFATIFADFLGLGWRKCLVGLAWPFEKGV